MLPGLGGAKLSLVEARGTWRLNRFGIWGADPHAAESTQIQLLEQVAAPQLAPHWLGPLVANDRSQFWLTFPRKATYRRDRVGVEEHSLKIRKG